ncbi:MAG: SDR family oxidoreductase [Acinetobacter populi]|jgi:NAD(P)-dependent dehydrogenase (short-subunit alcohol dehydrogenase family)|uniref:SDR family oxidoreductase n=1 Tax=Acinetobacter populi TaxID=1582270 RepID=UPI002356BDB3|nr:SDR family oxidoreductase [Acinetobacter populi]MCH4248084.1 SDR family oxidoreductase [Acinetobacter populi]
MSQHSLKDKTVVITGGAKNLGGLISRQFAKQGANLVIHYNSAATQAQAEETLQAVQDLGAKAILVQADLSDIAEIENLFTLAKQQFGGVDIAINTVGRVLKKPFVETTEQEFDQMDVINNKIAYFFIQSAGKHLNEHGKICSIVTSLLAAYTGLYSTYEGLKAPVEHYTRAASKEFGDRKISVTAVAPGPMDTPFFYGQEAPEAVAYHKSASALGGLTKIEDIEPLVRFLVTDGWWITGQTIFANGGYTTR